MEATILGKGKNSPADNDLPLPGHKPPRLRPVNLQEDPATNPIEDESNEPVISDDLDEISWLNGKDNSLAEGIHSTEGDRFTLAGLEGIEICSPWLRGIVGSAPTKQTQRSAVSAPDLPSSSQIVPNTSAWEIWE